MILQHKGQTNLLPSAAVHTCNHSTRRLSNKFKASLATELQSEFKASLLCIARPCLKTQIKPPLIEIKILPTLNQLKLWRLDLNKMLHLPSYFFLFLPFISEYTNAHIFSIQLINLAQTPVIKMNFKMSVLLQLSFSTVLPHLLTKCYRQKLFFPHFSWIQITKKPSEEIWRTQLYSCQILNCPGNEN